MSRLHRPPLRRRLNLASSPNGLAGLVDGHWVFVRVIGSIQAGGLALMFCIALHYGFEIHPLGAVVIRLQLGSCLQHAEGIWEMCVNPAFHDHVLTAH